MRAAGTAVGGERAVPHRDRLATLLAVVAGATVAAGLLARAAGVRLGSPLPPFFVTWDPAASPAAVPAVVALALAVVLAPRLRSPALGPGAFALAAAGLALVTLLALAAAGEGPLGWYSVYGPDAEGANEYLPALPALSLGVHAFLDRFAELAPTLPIHPSTHPPGMVLLLYALGISSAQGMAALTVGATALCAPLTYALGRQVATEGVARIAAILLAFSPAFLIYGAASADALFACVATAALVALVSRRTALTLLGAVLLLGASLLSFALLGAGVLAVLVVLQRDGLAPAARVAGVCAAAVLGGYGALWALFG